MIKRHVLPRVLEALNDTPAVYLQGARQAGKSTLAQAIGGGGQAYRYYSLDSSTVLSAAAGDPEGFVRGLEGPVVIDEVQRVPDLARAIKASIDAQRRPGRFLLTGSASVMALPELADPLAGRVELLTLWPFSQGEILGRRETFIDRVCAARLDTVDAGGPRESDLLRRMVAGGYPEAVLRERRERRSAWFDSYVTTVLQRSLRDLANIERLAEIPRILALLASRVGQLLNYADLGRSLSVPASTLKRYLTLLEATFLVRLLPAWFSNIGKRLVKSPKVLMVDTGLLCHVLDLDGERLRSDRTLFGHVLENFVAMELIKQASWSTVRARLYHFRTEAGREVDFVLETTAGRIVGIEVKSGATAEQKDFDGMRALSQAAGERFVRGIVLHLGDAAVPFGPALSALPITTLWS
ncbi:MAG TPA: hypothetical protein DCM87_02860 [Planctomycetes bacterium]|nr:hypothetical protein [Planctomycetota bacterium]